MATTVDQLVNVLEDTAALLQKTQINLKKCPKARLTKGYITIRIKTIDDYWSTFKKTHNELVRVIDKEQKAILPYFVNEEFYIYEDLYLVLVAELQDLMSSLSSREQNTPPSNVSMECDAQKAHVMLPRILLPTFEGNYDDWPTYQDLFISLVHENKTLSDVQKLHYLKCSITGEAEALLKHIKVTQQNYEQAWDMLKQRYGNKRLIVNSVLKRLFSQKKIVTPTATLIKNLVDTTSECLNSLQNLQIPTDSWGPVIIYSIVQKLDIETHKAWEDASYNEKCDELPTWIDLKNFLEAKFRTLELITPSSFISKDSKVIKKSTCHVSTPAQEKSCVMCKEKHTLSHCKEFTKLSPKERSEIVKTKQLCYNCLTSGHTAYKCRLRVFCKQCNRRHHTLLHEQRGDNQLDNLPTHHSLNEENEEDITKSDEEELQISSYMAAKKSAALLATALVPVKDNYGNITILRALIDQGSQANFVSERATQLLKVKKIPAKGTITGVGSTQSAVNYVVELKLLSRYDKEFQCPVKAYVMKTKITTQLPTKMFEFSTHSWPYLHKLFLADPSFNKPGRIDLLLGVEVYANIIKNNIVKGSPGSPCAQETSFGWILFGNIHCNTHSEEMLVMHHQVDVDDILQKFWEIDSDDKKKLTKEEEICEKIYEESYKRNSEGRYIVKLPLKYKESQAMKGNTRDICKKRLIQLEKRLERNKNLRSEYNKVMEEYLNNDHMEAVPENEIDKPSVYLPHHAVVREASDTTKVRVVFNASSPATNKVSLNDDLLVGPQLQEDMRSLVMRWRLKRVGFVADIEKMYRQILVTKEDSDLQRLLWRSNPRDPIQDFRLLRVTFGTASAPYLAVRTLQQVAKDEGKQFPKAAETICNDFFMDDLISGQDTTSKAIEIAKDIERILNKGGFVLQKWSSNSKEFLKEFSTNQISTHVKIDVSVGGTVRTLGLFWKLDEDVLQYNINLQSAPETVTKRNILAEIQHFFDPLGWLAPALLPAKLILQKLWLKGINWDEEIDAEIKDEWMEIRQSFQNVKDIKINRWLYTTEDITTDATICGFCDASTKGYGAVAYLRVKTKDGKYKTGVIAARTRVAPVKPVSLPRLELCGAVLLSKLLKQISQATRIPKTRVFAWTDSTIVLSWLRGDPGRWQTFVRNRVVTILDNIGHKWYHVESNHNPADAASRGMRLSELRDSKLWWEGPEWLRQDELMMHEVKESVDLERKKDIKINVNTKIEIEPENKSLLTQFEEFDTLAELTKTIAYCKRFLNFKRNISTARQPLTPEELNKSLEDCVKLAQNQDFNNEIQRLFQRKPVSSRSIIRKLNPTLDDKGILRVGGRLRHAEINEDVKHPMILNRNNPLALLIVAEAHKVTLHGGVQLMMNYIRSRFWIVRVKSLIHKTIHRCVTCARQRTTAQTQMMGDLPEVRVSPARPFYNSGVDFAGPLSILRSKGRGSRCEKAYICIFICLSTKAVHLELVSDMSTKAFISAFKRFVARRGRCGHMWSDRGTNFVGASKELTAMWNESKLELPENLVTMLAEDGTKWHFNPPYSPNFGGIWEAGVKSIKYHLKRILNINLTFEEMTTTLCQIEACLNSRPLCPVDGSDADNLNILTPGHFLIGEAPINVPEPNLSEVNWNYLSRWQHTQKLVQHFWYRWKTEYLTRLQQRPKWMKPKKEFQIGDIVIIKEDQLPPGKWALGRITQKHPGLDNLCRVYSVKCGNKIIQRSVSKLCELPINS